MKKELQDSLFKKYPEIFRQKDLPLKQTAMCWGMECDDGWYWLIDRLCASLQFDIEKNNYPSVEATQVKEKYGTLRFYVDGADERQHAVIDFAEQLSASICERCGTIDGVTQTKSGWIKSLCKKCMKKGG